MRLQRYNIFLEYANKSGFFFWNFRNIQTATLIRKRIISALIDKAGNSIAGNSRKKTADEIRQNGHTRRRGYTRIEAEAGGAARRIGPSTDKKAKKENKSGR